MTRLQNASSSATTDIFVVRESPPVPKSAWAEIIWLTYSVEDDLPLPEGFTTIESIVDEFECDAAGEAAMIEARQFVGEKLYQNHPLRLAAYRLAKGWSQKRLAEEIGTSQSHVARLETGRSDPQISTVRKMSSVLGISIEEFARAFEVSGKS